MSNGRPNIALLAANLIDDFSASVAKGAMAAAERLGADLVIFPGKYIGLNDFGAVYDISYEYQYNVLFQLASEGGFDYIIAPVGTIAYALDKEEQKRFVEGLGPSPVICVAADIEGYDSLTFDNRSGIYSIVDELAAQGRKHIAILAGDMHNIDCAERYEAFRERLDMHGIPFEEKYFFECEMNPYAYSTANELLDSCPEVDAVVCVNDTIALQMCRVLKERGIRIGEEVAVTGFDDIPEAAEYDPPIATVHADAETLGARALELAVNRLRGTEDSPERMETVFVMRDSCRRERTAPAGYERIKENQRRELEAAFKARIGADNVFVRDVMMFGSDLKYSYAAILKQLPLVGAMTGFVYTYPEPVRHLSDEPFPKGLDWIFRSYNYGAEVHLVPENEQRITSREVYDNKNLCADRQHCFIAADLYSAEMQYGIALLEPADAGFFSELELITFILGSAVRTINILRGQEQLLNELNMKNLALEKESKIDELTGLMNRRGFFLAAEKLFGASQDNRYVVCYADLDDLKTVNDTHGHLEGDFSLKLTAECLRKVFGERAVIGRTGGDEFNVIVPCCDNGDVQRYAASAEKFIEEFNASGQKPYEFGISTGIIECVCENSYDLRSALDKADDLLYAVKQERKRRKKK